MKDITPLKKTVLFGFIIVFLFSGFTPAQAASKSATGNINPDAFVYILNMGIKGAELHYKGLRNGFAVGDGHYVLTAAHCVVDIKNTNNVLCHPIVISPYYGDLFEAEIVAVDDVNDIALLKPTWEAHPALELETSDNWKKSKKITIMGYPPIDPEKGGNGENNSRDLKSETVKIVNLNGEGNRAITVGPVKYVGEGWSGSAFIVPKTGKVAGITCTKFIGKPKLQLLYLFKISMAEKWYITGCDLDSINALFEQHKLDYGTRNQSFPDLNGKRRFTQILSMLDAIQPGNDKQVAASIQNLYDKLPDSYVLRCLTGTGFNDPNNRAAFEEMIESAPDSLFAHAAYGNYLMSRNKLKNAAEQFEYVTRRDPDHLFASHELLSALVKTDPNAAEDLGRKLIEKRPDNAGFHFEYSKALRENDKRKAELPVIQHAVDLCDPNEVPYSYLRYLADSLTVNQQYEPAEKTYIKLLEKHECDRCWWAYTILLLEMGPDKIEQAEIARDKTMSFTKNPDEVSTRQHTFEERVERMLSDPNTVEQTTL